VQEEIIKSKANMNRKTVVLDTLVGAGLPCTKPNAMPTKLPLHPNPTCSCGYFSCSASPGSTYHHYHHGLASGFLKTMAGTTAGVVAVSIFSCGLCDCFSYAIVSLHYIYMSSGLELELV